MGCHFFNAALDINEVPSNVFWIVHIIHSSHMGLSWGAIHFSICTKLLLFTRFPFYIFQGINWTHLKVLLWAPFFPQTILSTFFFLKSTNLSYNCHIFFHIILLFNHLIINYIVLSWLSVCETYRKKSCFPNSFFYFIYQSMVGTCLFVGSIYSLSQKPKWENQKKITWLNNSLLINK